MIKEGSLHSVLSVLAAFFLPEQIANRSRFPFSVTLLLKCYRDRWHFLGNVALPVRPRRHDKHVSRHTGSGISTSAPHMAGMNKTFPQFEPQKTRGGRWFVSVKTGNGPDSHIGDFETEAEARHWISAKSKYWPSKHPASSMDPDHLAGLANQWE